MKQRVLGYKLAFELSQEEMVDIAGGSAAASGTYGSTIMHSGPFYYDTELDSDVALDASM